MSTVRAAGGVVWRRGPDSSGPVEVVLVHRPKYDDWSLPKGKLESGESEEDAALREVREETGLRCDLGEEIATIEYVDHLGREKSVRYWAMTSVADESGPDDEVDQVVWTTVAEARRRLSYPRDVAVLDCFEDL